MSCSIERSRACSTRISLAVLSTMRATSARIFSATFACSALRSCTRGCLSPKVLRSSASAFCSSRSCSQSRVM